MSDSRLTFLTFSTFNTSSHECLLTTHVVCEGMSALKVIMFLFYVMSYFFSFFFQDFFSCFGFQHFYYEVFRWIFGTEVVLSRGEADMRKTSTVCLRVFTVSKIGVGAFALEVPQLYESAYGRQIGSPCSSGSLLMAILFPIRELRQGQSGASDLGPADVR